MVVGMSDIAITSEYGRRGLLGRPFTGLILAFGPILTIGEILRAVGSTWVPAIDAHVVLIAALLFWSPVFGSLPSILLQDARDRAMASWRGPARIARAVWLVPHLLLSPDSTVRLEMVLHLIGLVGAVALAWPML